MILWFLWSGPDRVGLEDLGWPPIWGASTRFAGPPSTYSSSFRRLAQASARGGGGVGSPPARKGELQSSTAFKPLLALLLLMSHLSKSHGQVQVQEVENRLHFLMRGAAKSHFKKTQMHKDMEHVAIATT